MKKYLMPAFAATALATGTPASSAVIIDGTTQVGDEWEAVWSYPSDSTMEPGEPGEWTLGEDIDLTALLTLASYNSDTATFTFDLVFTNYSTGGAVLTVWAFGTDPEADSFGLTTKPNGSWTTTMDTPSGSTSDGTTMPSGVDQCATTKNNCEGGDPSAGIISSGGTGTFQFTLDFDETSPDWDDSFELFAAYARFQNVDGTQSDCTGVDPMKRPDCGMLEDGEFSLKLLASTPLQTRIQEPPTEVPVAGSVPLMLLGLLGLAAAHRRRFN